MSGMLRGSGWLRLTCAVTVLASCQGSGGADAGQARFLAADITGATAGAARTPRSRVPAPRLLALSEKSEQAAARSCPEDMVALGSYCIDRYEATLVELGPDGRETQHSPYERPVEGRRYVARSSSGKFPQAYISRPEAESACEAAGKRLCSVNEWYDACRGSSATTYPYGEEYRSGACNVGKAHLLSRFFGPHPRAWKYREHFNNPMLNQQPGFLARTGGYEDCRSDQGVHDMVGNLHEWVSDQVDAELAAKLAAESGISVQRGLRKGRGIFMGGFYSTTNQHGTGCNFVTIGHEPQYHDYSTGFRCCRDAEPSSARRL